MKYGAVRTWRSQNSFRERKVRVLATHSNLLGLTADYPATLLHLIYMCWEAVKVEA